MTVLNEFDLAGIRNFADSMEARMASCDSGEGMECATVNDSLMLYSKLCEGFLTKIKSWGQAIFAGKVTLDPEVEKLFLELGKILLSKSQEVLEMSSQAEVHCYVLEGKYHLQALLWSLSQLLENWITPSLSVGPAARQEVVLTEEIRNKLESLPPLPEDWQPENQKQKGRYKRMLTN